MGGDVSGRIPCSDGEFGTKELADDLNESANGCFRTDGSSGADETESRARRAGRMDCGESTFATLTGPSLLPPFSGTLDGLKYHHQGPLSFSFSRFADGY